VLRSRAPRERTLARRCEEAGVWRRIVARIKRLDSMAKRLREVEKHVGLTASGNNSSEE